MNRRKSNWPQINADTRRSKKRLKLSACIGVHRRLFFLPLLLLVPALHAETFYLTIAGLGGAPEYDQRFTGWAKDIDKLLKTAEPNGKIVTLMGTEATKANVESKLRDITAPA